LEGARYQNIENNPMHSKEPLKRKGPLAWISCPQKHFDMSGKSGAYFYYSESM
jgi:hypothetical protein